MVLTAVLGKDVAPQPLLVGPESLDPGALPLPQSAGQGRVGLVVVVVVVEVRGQSGPGLPSSRLLPLLSAHHVKMSLQQESLSPSSGRASSRPELRKSKLFSH